MVAPYQRRLFSEPKLADIISKVAKHWDTESYGPDMWPSQQELMNSFIYWKMVDMRDHPIKHLYLYPCCGATTIWRCIEKAFDDVLLVPLYSHQTGYSTRFSIENTLVTDDHSAQIAFRDKVVIVDGVGCGSMKKSPSMLFVAGAKGAFIS